MKNRIITFCTIASLAVPALALDELRTNVLLGSAGVAGVATISGLSAKEKIRRLEENRYHQIAFQESRWKKSTETIQPFDLNGKVLSADQQKAILASIEKLGPYQDVHISYWHTQERRAVKLVIPVLEQGTAEVEAHLAKLSQEGAEVRSIVAKSTMLNEQVRRINTLSKAAQRGSQHLLTVSRMTGYVAGATALAIAGGELAVGAEQAVLDAIYGPRDSVRRQAE